MEPRHWAFLEQLNSQHFREVISLYVLLDHSGSLLISIISRIHCTCEPCSKFMIKEDLCCCFICCLFAFMLLLHHWILSQMLPHLCLWLDTPMFYPLNHDHDSFQVLVLHLPLACLSYFLFFKHFKTTLIIS